METDRICFNISGRYFHVQTSVFKGRFAQIIDKGFQETVQGRTEYFHPRHAGCFEAVLDYYQNGELHMPLNVCPGVFNRELEYWGISHEEISTCCKIRLDTFGEEMEITHILNQYDNPIPFADDKKESMSQFMHRSVVNPYHSWQGQVYFWISMGFVALSVFNLCAETHPLFKVSLSADEWEDYLGDSVKSYWNDLHKLHPDYFDVSYEHDPLEAYQDEGEDYEEYDNGVKANYTTNHNDELEITTAASNVSLSGMGNATENDKELPTHTFSVQLWVRCVGYACGIFFTWDIIMRFLVCPSKCRFFISFLNFIDILSLLPFYTEWIANLSDPTQRYTHSMVDGLHIASVVRVFRVFRLAKQSRGLHVFLLSLKSGIREILLLLFFLAIATLIFACLVFHAEKSVHFESIPDGFWWAIVTMTTVGYGDMYPRSFMGKIVGSLCVVCGVLVMAVTVPIFASKFGLYYQRSGKGLASSKQEQKVTKSNFVQPV